MDTPPTPFPVVRPMSAMPAFAPASDLAVLNVHLEYMRSSTNTLMDVASSTRDLVLQLKEQTKGLKIRVAALENVGPGVQTKWKTIRDLGLPLVSGFLSWASTYAMMHEPSQKTQPPQETQATHSPAP